jgi:hypothetical protein
VKSFLSIISVDKGSDGTPEIKGSAKVLQLRNNEAVAAIQDGSFVIGKKVARKAAPPKPVVTKPKVSDEPEYPEDEEIYETLEQRRARLKAPEEDNLILRRDLLKVALLGSFTQDQISAKEQDNSLPFFFEETVDMKGNSSGYGVSVDYPTRWGFVLRGVVLSEKVSVSGQTALANTCNGKTSNFCYTDITYLSTGLHMRYDYNYKRLTLWGALGGALKFPTERDTTALRQEDLQIANAVVASAGLEFAFNNKFFMPLSGEYHYSLNTSETVPVIYHTSFMVGFGRKF